MQTTAQRWLIAAATVLLLSVSLSAAGRGRMLLASEAGFYHILQVAPSTTSVLQVCLYMSSQ